MGPFLADVQQWLPTLSWYVPNAVCTALGSWGLHPRIKWPNDLLIGDRKVGGILIETEQSTHHGIIAIVGIGLNISTAPDVPPPGLPSTRLVDHMITSNVTKWLTPTALAIDLLEVLFAEAPATFLDLAQNQRQRALYLGRLVWTGEWVRVERDGLDPVTGVLTDVDDAGGLCLYSSAGEIVRLTGGVRRLRRLDGQGANDAAGD
jgi:BirA family biotin operon repressor/biotin-[acetyl-CoA-carboxylase] ligase